MLFSVCYLWFLGRRSDKTGNLKTSIWAVGTCADVTKGGWIQQKPNNDDASTASVTLVHFHGSYFFVLFCLFNYAHELLFNF